MINLTEASETSKFQVVNWHFGTFCLSTDLKEGMVVSRFPRSSEILAINKSLSWNAKEQDVVIVRVDGVTKLLE